MGLPAHVHSLDQCPDRLSRLCASQPGARCTMSLHTLQGAQPGAPHGCKGSPGPFPAPRDPLLGQAITGGGSSAAHGSAMGWGGICCWQPWTRCWEGGSQPLEVCAPLRRGQPGRGEQPLPVGPCWGRGKLCPGLGHQLWPQVSSSPQGCVLGQGLFHPTKGFVSAPPGLCPGSSQAAGQDLIPPTTGLSCWHWGTPG